MPVTAPVDVIGDLRAHAVGYADEGFEIFPVDPTSKRPMAAAVRGAPSQYDATTDTDVVEKWWSRWPDALIGHRLPEDQIILDIDPRHGGQDTWHALRDHLGFGTPDTRIHVSGRGDGGGHISFLRPEGKLTIARLDAWAEEHGTGHAASDTRWVCGLDLLHRHHRYTILPPSPHPETGQPYRWHQLRPITAAPAPLAELLIDNRPPPPPFEPKAYDGESIADWYSATQGLSALLSRHGWHLRSSGSGDEDGARWQHPLATSPVSATVRHGCLFVYSPNTPFEVTSPGDAHGITPFRAFAVLDHGGDLTAAAQAARELKDGPRATPHPGFGERPTETVDRVRPDIDPETGEILDEGQTPSGHVEVNWVDDDSHPPGEVDEIVTNLLAAGEVTVLGAPRAMGKTWATMQLATMCANGSGTMFGAHQLEVARPARVVYLQGELGRRSAYARWRIATHGDPPHVAEIFERLRIRVTTIRSTTPYEGESHSEERQVAIVDHRLEPLLETLGAEVLIIDPWATYFAGNENSNDETEAAIDALTQVVRRVGCACWIVHHITAKATHGTLAEPEDLWRGASRLADAVATRVTMLPHYTPAKARELGLDRFQARRYGDVHILQRNGPPVPVLHTRLEDFTWRSWDPPNIDGGRPEVISQRDVVWKLEQLGPLSKAALAEALGVSRPTLDDRLGALQQLGIVVLQKGPRGSHIVHLTEEELPE